jgi:ferritin-like protein
MNISNDILANVKNQPEDVSSVISFLIEDEEEAIEGYKSKLNAIEKQLDENQLLLVNDLFSHIIYEELEHIKELKELAKKLNVEI